MFKIPKFLRKADRFLLRNYPNIWCLQVHIILPLVFITAAILFLILFAQSPTTYMSLEESVLAWLSVVSFAGFVIWLIYMLRFNPMKSFGNRTKGDEWVNFIFIFKGAAFLVLLPFVFYLARYTRVHVKYTEKEMFSAINDINAGLALNRSIFSDSSIIRHADTWNFRSLVDGLKSGNCSYDSVYVDVADDSALHCFNMDQFTRLSSYGETVNEAAIRGLWDDKQVYYYLQKLKTQKDTIQIFEKFCAGMQFFTHWKYTPSEIYQLTFNATLPIGSLLSESLDINNNRRYSLLDQRTESAINIIEQNHKYFGIFRNGDWPDILHGLFYVAFYLTLFILIYRNMTLKTFMISIGVGFLVPILSVLIAVAGNFHSEEDAFVLAIIVYILTWLVYFMTRLNSRRSLAAGIALNLVTVTTPLLGWFIAEWWIEIYKNQHYNYDQIDWHLVDEVRFYGEVIGMLTFLILLQPVFKRFYVNWYSKPEE